MFDTSGPDAFGYLCCGVDLVHSIRQQSLAQYMQVLFDTYEILSPADEENWELDDGPDSDCEYILTFPTWQGLDSDLDGETPTSMDQTTTPSGPIPILYLVAAAPTLPSARDRSLRSGVPPVSYTSFQGGG